MRWLFLCGMIGQVKKNGGVVKCIPVFRNDDNNDNQYYTLTLKEDGEEIECTPIDISCYGSPLFLPASKKKIDDGKEYFFIFQANKSKEIFQWRVGADLDLQVGIYNNEGFCVIRALEGVKLTEEDMTRWYLNLPSHYYFR